MGSDGCKDGTFVHAGPPGGPPGTSRLQGDSAIGLANQPKCGGWLTPTVNMYARTAKGSDLASFSPFGKVEGPCLFGGCSELCCSSEFPVSRMEPGADPDAKLMRGDLGMITKKKPKDCRGCCREAFTDSDHFFLAFREGAGLTPQQKATTMASLVLVDYSRHRQPNPRPARPARRHPARLTAPPRPPPPAVLFEQDNGMCEPHGQGVRITLCDLYCCGCLCPCFIDLQAQGGGAPDNGTTSGAPDGAVMAR